MSAARQLVNRFALTHELLLAAAAGCTDDDLRWQPAPTAPSIAFHVWHCGRWADRWAATLRTSRGDDGVQRWSRDGLAARWGFPAALGGGDTGMGLSDDEAGMLRFPDRAALLDYVGAAFADLEAALAPVDDAALLVEADDLLGERPPLGDSLLRQLSHVSRHLGMIEALRGVRGARGTATV